MADKRRPETGINQVLQRLDIESSRTTQSEMDLTSRLARSRRDEAKAHDAVQRNTSLSLAQKYARTAEQRGRLEQQLQAEQERRVQGQWERTGSALQRSVLESNVRSDVASARDGDNIRAHKLASDPRYNVTQVRSSVQQRLDQARATISNIGAAGVFGEEERTQVTAAAKQYQSLVQQMAVVQDVERVKRREGTDEQGIIGRARENIGRYREAREGVAIAGGVQAGTYGSMGDIRKKSSETSAKLEAAEAELLSTLNSETKKRQELLKTIDGLNKETAENEKIMKEMARQGAGGSGRLGRILGNVAMGLQVGGQAISAISDVKQYGQVASRIEQMQLRTGFANIANQQYGDIQDMAQGDMAATLRVMGQAHGGADIFGRNLRAATDANVKGGMVGSVMSTVGSALGSAAVGIASGAAVGGLAGLAGFGVGAIPGAVVGGVLGGASSLISGAADVTKTGIGLARDIPGATMDLQGRAAYLQNFNEVNAVKADQMQQYRDAFVNYGNTARGMGSQTNAMIDTATGLQGRMADYGIGIPQQQRVQQMLYQNVGAALTPKSMEEASLRAGSLYSRGILNSPEQYAGMLGKVAGVGGSNRELADAMKAAVAAGLDTSKNIEEVVSGIQSMSAGGRVTGVSTIGGATAMTETAMMALKRAGIDPNLIQPTAANTVQNYGARSGTWGYNLETVYGVQSAARAGVTDPLKMALFAGAEAPALKAIKEKYKTDRIGAFTDAKNQGLEDVFDAKGELKEKMIDTLIRKKQLQANMGLAIMAPDIAKDIENGVELTPEKRRRYGIVSKISQQGKTSIEGEAAMTLPNSGEDPAVKAARDKIDSIMPGGLGGKLDTVNNLQVAGAAADVGKFGAGEKQFEKLGENINKFSEALAATVKGMDWEKISSSAEAASKNISGSLEGIDGTVKSLDQVLGNTVKRLEAFVDKMDARGFVGSNAPITPASTAVKGTRTQPPINDGTTKTP